MAEYKIPRIPVAIRSQINILRKLSVYSKLSLSAKDGYYLNRFFIYELGLDYLEDILSNWKTVEKLEFNRRLKDCIDINLLALENETKKRLNKRNEVITCIFELYKSQQFLGLIPLVLSQADGIMQEITGGEVGFYASHNEQKKVNPNRPKYLEKEFYVQFFAHYEQLNVDNRNDYQLFQKNITDLTKFNRHAILHGESYEFGNELNAIKSILFLTFMSEIYSVNFET